MESNLNKYDICSGGSAMKFKDFIDLVEKVEKKNPILFGLYSDKIASDKDINQIEKYYCIKFPENYKLFLKKYGGGYFAYTVVYSCDNNSDFCMLKNVDKEWVDKYSLFPIIDFETGDLGVFKVDNRMCEDLVYILVHGEENVDLHGEYDFLQALAKYGLRV